MPVGALRALVNATSQALHGVAVTVVRPAPNQDPVVTTGIWAPPLTDEVRVSRDFAAREPRRVLALPRADLDEVPRGTLITAPDESDDALYTWRVDSLSEVTADEWRVIVAKVGTPDV